MSNLELWDKVSVTDPDKTKNFKGKGGFQGTAVCAQSQRKKATEIFGVYGIDWGVTEEVFEIVELDKNDSHYKKLFYTAILYFTWHEKKGSFPIASEIDVFNYSIKYKSWSMGNDLYKKVRTDALTKGLSELGFNADIFEGKFDDNKYVQELKQEQNKPIKPEFNRNEAIKKIDALMVNADEMYVTDIQKQYAKCKTREDFKALYKTVEGEV